VENLKSQESAGSEGRRGKVIEFRKILRKNGEKLAILCALAPEIANCENE
jgi:hypothetical protein